MVEKNEVHLVTKEDGATEAEIREDGTLGKFLKSAGKNKITLRLRGMNKEADVKLV